MSTYVIGDIHGCLSELRGLLSHIDYQPEKDQLVLTGDLVNRGPDSLAVLRWACANDIEMVLGNHDLHLLARVQGISPAFPGDQLDELLNADDLPELLDWLRARPFLIDLDTHWVLHAGLHPDWSSEQTDELATKAAERLRSDPGFLKAVLAEHRDQLAFSTLEGDEALAQAARIICMVRGCQSDGSPVMGLPKGAVKASIQPWYLSGKPLERTICFGHDAMRGPYSENGAICVDSACGYGGPLSAYRIEDGGWFQSRSLSENSDRHEGETE